MSYIFDTPEQIAAKKQAKIASEKVLRMAQFRKRRNEKLAECDWTQLSDAPLTAEQRAAWEVYRQALRDVPATANDAGWVVWPKKPS